MNKRLDNLIRQWTRAGAMFDAEPSAQTPDLERMLLDTARLSPQMSRLFILVATWLNNYGSLIAKHRLKRLIREELAPRHQPALGLLLDIAQQGQKNRFAFVIRDLQPAQAPAPLFDIQRKYPSAIRKARMQSSQIAKRWNIWMGPFEFKPDAIRPPLWLMRHNPGFMLRADFKGDLRASTVVSLWHDQGAGRSELALSRATGGSRQQIRESLKDLELTGRIERVQDGNRNGVIMNQAYITA